jgi:hypothetical protein
MRDAGEVTRVRQDHQQPDHDEHRDARKDRQQQLPGCDHDRLLSRIASQRGRLSADPPIVRGDHVRHQMPAVKDTLSASTPSHAEGLAIRTGWERVCGRLSARSHGVRAGCLQE